MPTINYSGAPGTTIYAGLPTPPVGGIVTTMRLTNPTGSTQAANFVSKMVGLPFAPGDMPAGDWPRLTLEDDTTCPATFWGATTWPDGSLKWVGCMARIPASVAATSSIDILVKQGGTLDTTPTRTTADLTAADIKLVCQGTRALTGEWTASLNDGITTGPVVLLGSGPAGSFWRIGSEFRDGSNAAHGQLYHHHFVTALTNSSGDLAGLRYLGRSMQHWGDVRTPVPTNREFTAELLSGATQIREMIGVSPNTTPSRTSGPPGVVGTTISMPHYTSWYTAGGGAEYDFLPGTQLNECAVYWKHEAAYLATCGVFPRIDVTITDTVNMTPVDYMPYGKGNFESYDIGGATRQSEIGAMNQFSALHMINQSAEALRVIRINGMVFGGIGVGILDHVNQSVLPCVNYGETYPNMITPNPSLRLNQSNEMTGSGPLIAISDKTSVWRSSDITHRPGVCWYPYLITGEPQYLDMLVESAGQALITMSASTQTLDPGFPIRYPVAGGSSTGRNLLLNGVTYNGAGWYTRTELPRMFAWAIREMGHVAAFYPDVCPRGTGTRQYFRQIVDTNFELARAYREHQNAVGWTEYITQGIHLNGIGGSAFALPHLHQVICHLSSAYPTANSIGFRQQMSRFWNAISRDIDISCCSGFQYTMGNSLSRATTTALSCFKAGNDGHMDCSFDVATSRVSIIGTSPWIPTLGDKFRFYDTSFKPFADSGDEPYYVVNISGLSFQLSATPGGEPVTFTTGTARTSNFYCALQNYPASYSFTRSNGPEAYFAFLRGSILAARAAGDDVEEAYVKIQAKMPLLSISYRTNPKLAYAGASNTSGA